MLTLPEKKDRLRNLPAEVPDLHDWLSVLFQQLPNVLYVEYTHGRNEFGADFVLEILNATTGRNEFVGVIAKKGTIKQDTAEVERQIKECGIPRIIKNGKDEQSLPVIWVISNEVVTGNAERKIKNDYRQHAITFFSMDDIIRWTDNYAPHLWEDVPSKIGQYLQTLDKRLEDLDRGASLLSEQIDVKLELDLSPVNPDSYRNPQKKREYVSLLEEVKLRRMVFVEGPMGAGKSQLIRSLGRELCLAKVYNETKTLPIFSTYRAVVEEHGGSLEKLVSSVLGDLMNQIEEDDLAVALLIDGLDELPPNDSEETPLQNLAKQVRQLKYVKAVFSCRSGVIPIATLKVTQDLRHLEVRPLTVKKMTSFIKNVCERAKLSNRIARDLGKSDLFRQLPQNPIAALLLTRLMLQSRDRDELPQTLSSLYEKALELMLGRWDMDKGLGSQQEYDVARRLCGELATFMIDNKITTIGVGEIKSRLHSYLEARNLTVNEPTLLNRLFARSGVLVLDESSLTVSFKHRSFAEFFYAEEWLRTNQFVVDGRALEGYWATIYFFAVGKLADCESVLKEILAVQPISDDQRLGKIFAAPMYLLAGHMTPYSVVEENFSALLLEAGKLHVDVLEGRHQSILSSLSPMALLFIMQYVLREKYGYQFFRRAIDAAAITIADSIDDTAVKAHALFFLGAIGIDLDYPEAMHFLLEKYDATELPIGLSAAVVAETERRKSRTASPLLRAFNKRVQKMLKNSQSLRSTLDGLMKRPITPEKVVSRL